MRSLWILLTAVGVAACGGRAAEPEKPAAAAHEEHEPGVHVAADVQQQWGITVSPAEKTALTGTVTLTGILTLNQDRTAEISATVAGKAKSIGAGLGDWVRRNQVLVTIHAPALAQAKIMLLQGRAKLELATREYERGQALVKLEAIDQKELLRRKTEYETAVSDMAVAESTLHSLGLDQPAVDAVLAGAAKDGDHLDHFADPDLRLVSPFDGRIVQRDVVTGQHVQPETRLFTVSDLSTLWAWLDAREVDLPHLAKGRPVRIRTSVYPDRVWAGEILQVGDIVDAKTRTVKLRVQVRNDGALKPNMYIDGEIPGAATNREVVTVPDAAIQTVEGEPVVFVREEADHFAPRPVELGERINGRRVVLKGLEAGEPIAVAGAFKLKAELLKATLAGDEHGHSH